MLDVGSSVSDVIEYLRYSGTQKQTERVVSRGVDLEHILGTPKKIVQESAKSLGRNHKLAVDLWDIGFHESRLVAVLIADPTAMSVRLSRDWTNSFWSWDLCDHFSRYLLPYITDPDGLIEYCASQAGVFVRRTAFAGIACSLIHRNDIDEDQIEVYLEQITEGSFDSRHHVRKAVVWALVEIGKCNFERQEVAIIHAAELMEGEKAQQWVGRNALKELETLVKVSERERLLTSRSKTGAKRIGKHHA